MKRCFTIIDKNAKLVLESDDFEDVSLELLKHIIKRDTLEIDSGMWTNNNNMVLVEIWS